MGYKEKYRKARAAFEKDRSNKKNWYFEDGGSVYTVVQDGEPEREDAMRSYEPPIEIIAESGEIYYDPETDELVPIGGRSHEVSSNGDIKNGTKMQVMPGKFIVPKKDAPAFKQMSREERLQYVDQLQAELDAKGQPSGEGRPKFKSGGYVSRNSVLPPSLREYFQAGGDVDSQPKSQYTADKQIERFNRQFDPATLDLDYYPEYNPDGTPLSAEQRGMLDYARRQATKLRGINVAAGGAPRPNLPPVSAIPLSQGAAPTPDLTPPMPPAIQDTRRFSIPGSYRTEMKVPAWKMGGQSAVPITKPGADPDAFTYEDYNFPAFLPGMPAGERPYGVWDVPPSDSLANDPDGRWRALDQRLQQKGKVYEWDPTTQTATPQPYDRKALSVRTAVYDDKGRDVTGRINQYYENPTRYQREIQEYEEGNVNEYKKDGGGVGVEPKTQYTQDKAWERFYRQFDPATTEMGYYPESKPDGTPLTQAERAMLDRAKREAGQPFGQNALPPLPPVNPIPTSMVDGNLTPSINPPPIKDERKFEIPSSKPASGPDPNNSIGLPTNFATPQKKVISFYAARSPSLVKNSNGKERVYNYEDYADPKGSRELSNWGQRRYAELNIPPIDSLIADPTGKFRDLDDKIRKEPYIHDTRRGKDVQYNNAASVDQFVYDPESNTVQQIDYYYDTHSKYNPVTPYSELEVTENPRSVFDSYQGVRIIDPEAKTMDYGYKKDGGYIHNQNARPMKASFYKCGGKAKRQYMRLGGNPEYPEETRDGGALPGGGQAQTQATQDSLQLQAGPMDLRAAAPTSVAEPTPSMGVTAGGRPLRGLASRRYGREKGGPWVYADGTTVPPAPGQGGGYEAQVIPNPDYRDPEMAIQKLAMGIELDPQEIEALNPAYDSKYGGSNLGSGSAADRAWDPFVGGANPEWYGVGSQVTRAYRPGTPMDVLQRQAMANMQDNTATAISPAQQTTRGVTIDETMTPKVAGAAMRDPNPVDDIGSTLGWTPPKKPIRQPDVRPGGGAVMDMSAMRDGGYVRPSFYGTRKKHSGNFNRGGYAEGQRSAENLYFYFGGMTDPNATPPVGANPNAQAAATVDQGPGTGGGLFRALGGGGSKGMGALGQGMGLATSLTPLLDTLQDNKPNAQKINFKPLSTAATASTDPLGSGITFVGDTYSSIKDASNRQAQAMPDVNLAFTEKVKTPGVSYEGPTVESGLANAGVGALGGAATGAQIGAKIGGPIGAAVAGGVGLIAGAIPGILDATKANRLQRRFMFDKYNLEQDVAANNQMVDKIRQRDRQMYDQYLRQGIMR